MWCSSMPILFSFASLPAVLATPFNLTRRDPGQNVHCGTTADATLSDCQQLVDPATWSAAFAGSSNECQ